MSAVTGLITFQVTYMIVLFAALLFMERFFVALILQVLLSFFFGF